MLRAWHDADRAPFAALNADPEVTEHLAARASLDHGFDRLRLHEIVSMTTVGNIRSQHVMGRLGMSHDPADDFDHPSLPEGSPLRPHVLYRIPAPRRHGPQR